MHLYIDDFIILIPALCGELCWKKMYALQFIIQSNIIPNVNILTKMLDILFIVMLFIIHVTFTVWVVNVPLNRPFCITFSSINMHLIYNSEMWAIKVYFENKYIVNYLYYNIIKVFNYVFRAVVCFYRWQEKNYIIIIIIAKVEFRQELGNLTTEFFILKMFLQSHRIYRDL